jgi:SAM-dependent methyltransferase
MGAEETQQLLGMFFGAHLSYAVGAVAELGLADQIEDGQSRPVGDLAAASATDRPTLYRVLRFLASHDIFEETVPGSFGHTRLSRSLRSDAEGSSRPAMRLAHYILPSLQKFDHTLRTGESALTAWLGKPMFEYLPEHPDEAAMFDAAMPSFHLGETEAMLEAFDFSGIGTLADIGGGGGTLLAATLQRYPEMKGILFDLGHAAGRARAGFASAGLQDRCQVIEGSFFESVPGGADAYLMRHIIHDWNDEQSIQILRNCRKATGSGGRLFLVETIVPEGNDPAPGKEMDMGMLLYPGGMERTEAEYAALFDKSGFDLAGITLTASPVCVIEGRPV